MLKKNPLDPAFAQIVILCVLSFLLINCSPLENKFDSTVNVCGADAVPGQNYAQVYDGNGKLLTNRDFNALKLDQDPELITVNFPTEKGCISLSEEGAWLLRSRDGKYHTKIIVKKDHYPKQIALTTSNLSSPNLKCPTSIINNQFRANSLFSEVSEEHNLILVASYEIMRADERMRSGEFVYLNKDVVTFMGGLEDGDYTVSLKVKNLINDIEQKMSCEIVLTSTTPQVTPVNEGVEEISYNKATIFRVKQDQNLRFSLVDGDLSQHNSVFINYCFTQIDQYLLDSNLAVSENDINHECSPDVSRSARINEAITPQFRTGFWKLNYQVHDEAGNVSEWYSPKVFLYTQDHQIESIKFDGREENLQNYLSTNRGVSVLLAKTLENLHRWESLPTDWEREASRIPMLSMLITSEIFLNKDGPIIPLPGTRADHAIITSDNRRIISGSTDGAIRVWDIETGKLLSTLVGHPSSISALDLSPDDSYLISGSYDRSIIIWDMKKEEKLRQICCFGDSIRLAISPDKKKIVSSSWDGEIKIWDLEGNLKKVISRATDPNFHTDVIMAIDISPDGTKFATGSWDNSVRVWDLETGEFIFKTSTDHSDDIFSLVITPDGEKVISASKDRSLIVSNLSDGSLDRIIYGSTDSITSVQVSENNIIVAGSMDNYIRKWDLITGYQIGEALRVDSFLLDSVAISKDGDIIVSTTDEPILRVWNNSSRNSFVRTLREPQSNVAIRSLDVNLKHGKVVSGSDKGLLRLWDVKSGDLIQSIEAHEDTIYQIKWPEGLDQIFTSSKDSTLRSWEYTHEAISSRNIWEYEDEWLFSLDYDPQSSQLAIGTWGGRVIFKSFDDALLDQTVDLSSAWLKVAFNPSNQTLLTATRGGILHTWDLESQQIIQTDYLSGENKYINSLEFSPNKGKLYIALWNGKVEIWDLNKNISNGTIDTNGRIVWDIALSADEKTLFTATNDGKIRMWDTETGALLGVPIPAHGAAIRVINTSLNGFTITGSDDGTVKIWNIQPNIEIQNLKMKICSYWEVLQNSPWLENLSTENIKEVCNP
ncbi:MAG: WD40 repeat domain-containing protein [Oligoflexus sp.]